MQVDPQERVLPGITWGLPTVLLDTSDLPKSVSRHTNPTGASNIYKRGVKQVTEPANQFVQNQRVHFGSKTEFNDRHRVYIVSVYNPTTPGLRELSHDERKLRADAMTKITIRGVQAYRRRQTQGVPPSFTYRTGKMQKVVVDQVLEQGVQEDRVLRICQYQNVEATYTTIYPIVKSRYSNGKNDSCIATDASTVILHMITSKFDVIDVLNTPETREQRIMPMIADNAPIADNCRQLQTQQQIVNPMPGSFFPSIAQKKVPKLPKPLNDRFMPPPNFGPPKMNVDPKKELSLPKSTTNEATKHVEVTPIKQQQLIPKPPPIRQIIQPIPPEDPNLGRKCDFCATYTSSNSPVLYATGNSQKIQKIPCPECAKAGRIPQYNRDLIEFVCVICGFDCCFRFPVGYGQSIAGAEKNDCDLFCDTCKLSVHAGCLRKSRTHPGWTRPTRCDSCRLSLAPSCAIPQRKHGSSQREEEFAKEEETNTDKDSLGKRKRGTDDEDGDDPDKKKQKTE